MNWKIYYGDGSAFSSDEGTPDKAPTTNVQCIAYYDEDGRRKICHSADYYWFDSYWHGGDLFGLWDYLARGGHTVVKFGRSVNDLTWRAIMSKADNDLPLERAT